MSSLNLIHHFLLAMPGMKDPLFDRAVIYICEHNEHGAMGMMINKPSGVELARLLEQVSITPDLTAAANVPVYVGGPVQTDRGFVLHQKSGDWQSTLHVSSDVSLTTSRDILSAIAQGIGPKKFMVSLGYAAWSQGQLEEELLENSWLTIPAVPSIIFDALSDERYDLAMHSLGIDPTMLSVEAGHA
jgi:putative transcriptional regulator